MIQLSAWGRAWMREEDPRKREAIMELSLRYARRQVNPTGWKRNDTKAIACGDGGAGSGAGGEAVGAGAEAGPTGSARGGGAGDAG